jgi:hypothetical protein
MKKDTKQQKAPYFTRFLEAQELSGVAAGMTLKYPSDNDETLKFPSEDDE